MLQNSFLVNTLICPAASVRRPLPTRSFLPSCLAGNLNAAAVVDEEIEVLTIVGAVVVVALSFRSRHLRAEVVAGVEAIEADEGIEVVEVEA